MIMMILIIIHIYKHANTKTEAYNRELAKHFKPPPQRTINLGGAAFAVLPLWCCLCSAASVVLPRWCCLGGAASVVLPLWCCLGGAASVVLLIPIPMMMMMMIMRACRQRQCCRQATSAPALLLRGGGNSRRLCNRHAYISFYTDTTLGAHYTDTMFIYRYYPIS